MKLIDKVAPNLSEARIQQLPATLPQKKQIFLFPSKVAYIPVSWSHKSSVTESLPHRQIVWLETNYMQQSYYTVRHRYIEEIHNSWKQCRDSGRAMLVDFAPTLSLRVRERERERERFLYVVWALWIVLSERKCCVSAERLTAGIMYRSGIWADDQRMREFDRFILCVLYVKARYRRWWYPIDIVWYRY